MLLDLAISPLFAWGVFTGALQRETRASDTALAGVFSIALVAFMAAVVLGTTAAATLAVTLLAPAVLSLSRPSSCSGRSTEHCPRSPRRPPPT